MKNALITSTDIRFTLTDRIKILFGAKVNIRIETDSENEIICIPPSRTNILVYRLFSIHKKGYGQTGLPSPQKK
jgi:hypothetical protein